MMLLFFIRIIGPTKKYGGRCPTKFNTNIETFTGKFIFMNYYSLLRSP